MAIALQQILKVRPFPLSVAVVTSVISENNNKLTAENQELKTEKNILTGQIQNIEHNVTVVQQIIDAYCPIKDGSKFRSHNSSKKITNNLFVGFCYFRQTV